MITFATTPEAYSNTFSLLGMNIHFYSLFAFLGFLTAFILVTIRWKKRGFNPKEMENFLFYALMTAIGGARVWSLMMTPGTSISDWLNFFNMQGLAIQGGVIATAIFSYFYFHPSKGKSGTYIDAADVILPIVLVGHSIGRWGNFFNQEVYGAAVEVEQLWWVPTFIVENMFIDGSYRVPLFLIEMIINLAVFAVIITLVEKFFKGIKGISAASYLIGYGLTRIILENFRDQKDILLLFNVSWLRISVITSFAFIVAGGLLLWYVSIPQIKARKNGNQNLEEED